MMNNEFANLERSNHLDGLNINRNNIIRLNPILGKNIDNMNRQEENINTNIEEDAN